MPGSSGAQTSSGRRKGDWWLAGEGRVVAGAGREGARDRETRARGEGCLFLIAGRAGRGS
jgi:hypothetical protein